METEFGFGGAWKKIKKNAKKASKKVKDKASSAINKIKGDSDKKKKAMEKVKDNMVPINERLD